MASYKGIEFAKGYDKPFGDFKAEFSSTHVFKNIPSAEREEALKKAYKIATSENGKLPSTTHKVKENPAKNTGE